MVQVVRTDGSYSQTAFYVLLVTDEDVNTVTLPVAIQEKKEDIVMCVKVPDTGKNKNNNKQ